MIPIASTSRFQLTLSIVSSTTQAIPLQEHILMGSLDQATYSTILKFPGAELRVVPSNEFPDPRMRRQLLMIHVANDPRMTSTEPK
ncbi:hypothetical protein DER46DRAFT_602615 [Fusarium sp. MPI-SDFR-AT-0072]|nr:hypothetical protein DER46DRAFT_602615 [Fusarium sp. MPI-SDFR-AT-0072]